MYHLYKKPKKKIKMNLFPNRKKTHRHRKQTQSYQRGEAVGRERNYEFGISIHTAIYQLDNQEDLLYSTGNYTPYLEITYKGRESEYKEKYTYMYN